MAKTSYYKNDTMPNFQWADVLEGLMRLKWGQNSEWARSSGSGCFQLQFGGMAG